MSGGEIQLPPPGTRVQVIIEGRVIIDDGKPCIRTADGALYRLPASARVVLVSS